MRYFIELSYDGTAYNGWQIQPNAPSVQATLQQALSTLLRRDIEIVGAGRTDTGVNASCMIAHFDYEPLDTEQLQQLRYRLNKLLPRDIAIHGIRPVADTMHARFSATSRTYHYFIVTSKTPFEPYAYHFSLPLNFELMNEACRILMEYTDFTSFAKLHTDTKTNICTVTEAQWSQLSPIKWQFTITANRFLRNMVRAIVGTLLDVGRGAITLQQFRDIIEQKDRCAAGTSVPGNALFLADIKY